jgi:hypothetical protein
LKSGNGLIHVGAPLSCALQEKDMTHMTYFKKNQASMKVVSVTKPKETLGGTLW